MPFVTTELGPLACRVFQQSDLPPERAVVLCHGYGAPGDDLVPLGPELVQRRPSLDRVRFVFPTAPLSLDGMIFGDARAWWPLDMERLIALQTGQAHANLERMRAEVPEGLSKARRMLLALLEALTQQTKLPLSRIVLGGFSQGAMLATDVALRLEEAPAALAIFSGTLICEAEWRQKAPARKGLRVLQSHGRQDPLLPFANAEALRDLLTEAGLPVEFVPFDGEHTIAVEALERFADLLV